MEKLNCISDNDGKIHQILIENQEKVKFKLAEGSHAVNFILKPNENESKEFKRALKSLQTCKNLK